MANADLSKAWADLIDGLTLLSTRQNNEVSPFHCEHDELRVMADPASFTAYELDLLEGFGFTADPANESFYSFRFGSA